MNFSEITPFKTRIRISKDGEGYYVDQVEGRYLVLRNPSTGKTRYSTQDEYENKYQKFN